MKTIRVVALVVPMILVVAGGGVAADLSPERLYDQANQQFWDGEYQRAESTYRTLLKEYPDSDFYLDARYGLGRTLYKQGKMEDSLDHFQAVRRNHPESSVRGDALFSLAEVAILRNRTIRARELLRTFLDLFPDHVLEPTAREQLTLLEDTAEPEPEARGQSGNQSVPQADETTGSAPGPQLKSRSGGETEVREVLDPLQKSDSPTQGSLSDTESIPSDTESAGTEASGNQTGPAPSGNRISPVDTSGPDTGSSGKSTRGSTTPEAVPPSDTSPESGSDTRSRETRDTAPVNDTEPSSPPEGDTRTAGSTDVEESPAKPQPDPRSERLDRVRKLYREGKVDQARERFTSDLLTEAASPEDYFLAARIMNEEGIGDVDRSLDYVNQALQLHDDPPASYVLFKADLLLSHDQHSEAQTVLSSIDPENFTGEKNEQKARYYYLKGKISLRLEQPDEAFFHFMDAVRAAPSSRWARQARETIEDRL